MGAESGGGAPRFSSEELQRYSRNILLPEIGLAGQARLTCAHAFVVGTGGLGSPALLYLAAAGVGTLAFIDHDSVDPSNLQRQVLFHTEDIGRTKAYSAAERLRALNPNVRLIPHRDALSTSNVTALLADSDVVLETSDNFPTKFLVNDACVLLGKPLVAAGILRFEGQMLTVDPGRSACYRCLFRGPPPPDTVPSCAEAGVLGALAGTIGSLQALEALKIITGAGRPLYGKLLRAELLEGQLRTIDVPRRKDCAVCGERPTIRSVSEGDYGELPHCEV